ncbi:MAG TPA: hypothetical protein PLU54_10165, partial [Deltaproteobacteria bacterium]|nr:hypothetical protein [Deltaproteobacteria bacterium]
QETSRRLGLIAAQAVRDTGADTVVADCGACRIQLSHYALMPALDPAEIITQAMANTPKRSRAGSGIAQKILQTIQMKRRSA